MRVMSGSTRRKISSFYYGIKLMLGGASFCFQGKRGWTEMVYLFSVFQQAISAVSTTSELPVEMIFFFQRSADGDINHRRRLLRAR